jgi:murein DD-endopeptidase MepM/ murein hydrolase activator NlpD
MLIAEIKRWFRSYRGRHFLSRWGRIVFDRARAQVALGYQLAAVAAVLSVTDMSMPIVVGKHQVQTIVTEDTIIEQTVTTETTLAWPVKNPAITQGFHYAHTAIDVQDKGGNLRVYPVDEGWVIRIMYSSWGYGNHVYIQHPNGRISLYGHLQEVQVIEGQSVGRDTVVGMMGRSGWASGVHLHLEVYQDGKMVDPITLLPSI